MSISATGLTDIANFIAGHVATGRVTLNSVPVSVPVYDTKLDGNVLKIYVLLDNAFEGNITQVELVDVNGAVFDSEPDNIQKIDTKLLLVTFKYTITSILEV